MEYFCRLQGHICKFSIPPMSGMMHSWREARGSNLTRNGRMSGFDHLCTHSRISTGKYCSRKRGWINPLTVRWWITSQAHMRREKSDFRSLCVSTSAKTGIAITLSAYICISYDINPRWESFSRRCVLPRRLPNRYTYLLGFSFERRRWHERRPYSDDLPRSQWGWRIFSRFHLTFFVYVFTVQPTPIERSRSKSWKKKSFWTNISFCSWQTHWIHAGTYRTFVNVNTSHPISLLVWNIHPWMTLLTRVCCIRMNEDPNMKPVLSINSVHIVRVCHGIKAQTTDMNVSQIRSELGQGNTLNG
jgi:hypothetical protein